MATAASFVCHVRTLLLSKATRSFDGPAGAYVPSNVCEAGWPTMSFDGDRRAGACLLSEVCVVIEPAVRVALRQSSGTCVLRGKATRVCCKYASKTRVAMYHAAIVAHLAMTNGITCQVVCSAPVCYAHISKAFLLCVHLHHVHVVVGCESHMWLR